jgi:hypothetical protein
MPVAKSDILPGYEVYSSDGRVMGHALEVRERAVLIKNDSDRDVYIPLWAVEDVSDSKVSVGLTAEQVQSGEWPEPPGGAV